MLWESGAVLTYLVQEYDKIHRLTYDGGNEAHLINQWLYFQASGQGPYYGQAAWYVLPLFSEQLNRSGLNQLSTNM